MGLICVHLLSKPLWPEYLGAVLGSQVRFQIRLNIKSCSMETLCLGVMDDRVIRRERGIS